MKKLAITLMTTFGLVGTAFATGDHRAEYNRYLSSATGDATPMDYQSWMDFNGYAKRSDAPLAELTESQKEYMAFAESFGDGSAPGYMAWTTADEPVIVTAKKPMTELERQYLSYANSYGDASPPSFAQWKSNLPRTDMNLAENSVK